MLTMGTRVRLAPRDKLKKSKYPYIGPWRWTGIVFPINPKYVNLTLPPDTYNVLLDQYSWGPASFQRPGKKPHTMLYVRLTVHEDHLEVI